MFNALTYFFGPLIWKSGTDVRKLQNMGSCFGFSSHCLHFLFTFSFSFWRSTWFLYATVGDLSELWMSRLFLNLVMSVLQNLIPEPFQSSPSFVAVIEKGFENESDSLSASLKGRMQAGVSGGSPLRSLSSERDRNGNSSSSSSSLARIKVVVGSGHTLFVQLYVSDLWCECHLVVHIQKLFWTFYRTYVTKFLGGSFDSPIHSSPWLFFTIPILLEGILFWQVVMLGNTPSGFNLTTHSSVLKIKYWVCNISHLDLEDTNVQ